jgi:UDP-glucose 4-epimerase
MTGSRLQLRYEAGGLTFVKNRIGSPARAREELGFEAKVELEQGLRALIAWRDGHKTEVAQRRALVA